MLTVDGSVGEGGGQILRSSLSLSAITGRPIKVINVRAKRANPGLAKQHLMSIQAAAEITQAKVDGVELGSTEFSFEPGPITAGDYTWRIDSAGSVGLVLQTAFPILLCAQGSDGKEQAGAHPSAHHQGGELTSRQSTVTIWGGTHCNMAPPAHYIAQVFAPAVRSLGFGLDVTINRHGFFPVGQGCITAVITPPQIVAKLPSLPPNRWATGTGSLKGISCDVVATPKTTKLFGDATVSFADSECHALNGLVSALLQNPYFAGVHAPPPCAPRVAKGAPGPGLMATVALQYADGHQCLFSRGGDPWREQAGESTHSIAEQMYEFFTGKPLPEKGADALTALASSPASAFCDFPVDTHLADQLLIPLVLAGGGTYRTGPLSLHSLTNIQTMKLFFPALEVVAAEEQKPSPLFKEKSSTDAASTGSAGAQPATIVTVEGLQLASPFAGQQHKK